MHKNVNMFHLINHTLIETQPETVVNNQTKITNIRSAVRFSWLQNAYSCPLSEWAILTHKVGQIQEHLSINPQTNKLAAATKTMQNHTKMQP